MHHIKGVVTPLSQTLDMRRRSGTLVARKIQLPIMMSGLPSNANIVEGLYGSQAVMQPVRTGVLVFGRTPQSGASSAMIDHCRVRDMAHGRSKGCRGSCAYGPKFVLDPRLLK